MRQVHPPSSTGTASCRLGSRRRSLPNDEELKMSRPEHFEMLVLGSGEGGKYLAWHMAKSGHRTAVVERKMIGASCPNTNCLPSKNEIWSAKVADLVRHADRFGIDGIEVHLGIKILRV